MPSKDIKAFRQAGRLKEALDQALADVNRQPENIWAKRNLCWVYYDFAKQNNTPENFDVFVSYLDKIDLPEDEKLLFDVSARMIIKMGYALLRAEGADTEKFNTLFDITKKFHYTKPSEIYSALFRVFHKAFRDNPLKYIELAEWWDFTNFRNEDYNRETMPDERTVMSLVEQAYVAYAKSLLPTQLPNGDNFCDRERATAFLLALDKIEEEHPEYQYPPYYKAKLLLAYDNKDNVLTSLLPYVKKKRNEYWIWDILSEVYAEDDEKQFACYCRGLLCFTPEEMLVRLRTKIVPYFLKKQMWDEAKTEILLIQKTHSKKGWKMPEQIDDLTKQQWFFDANEQEDNKSAYRQFAPAAEEVLYHDIPEISVIVTFINDDKKVLNFAASEDTFGFFKYDRLLKNVQTGDTYKIRYVNYEPQAFYQVVTIKQYDDLELKHFFLKEFQGAVKMRESNTFGFVDDVFLPSVLCKENELVNGCSATGNAIKTFDAKKNKWSWKAYEVQNISNCSGDEDAT